MHAGRYPLITYPDGKSVSVTYATRQDISHQSGILTAPKRCMLMTTVSESFLSGGELDHVRFRLRQNRQSHGNNPVQWCRKHLPVHSGQLSCRGPACTGTDLLAHLVYKRDANGNVTEERAFLPLQPDHTPQPFMHGVIGVGQVVSWGAQSSPIIPVAI